MQDKMNTINFKARYIDDTVVKYRCNDGTYADKEVFFVKRNPYSKMDYYSISDVSLFWGNKPNYVESMLHHSDLMVNGETRNVYILTEQKGNYRKIDPEKVLGMIEITRLKKVNKINFIQTRPDTKFGEDNRQYLGIGFAMLGLADKLSKGRKIILSAVKDAVKFYQKYGYKITYIGKDYTRMIKSAI